jgi:uncharacterized membrane protein YhhN
MKKNLYAVPALFFAIACLLNWAGRIWAIPDLSAAVKPALLPLLAASVLAYAVEHSLNRRMLFLLIAAELFGCAGDVFLLSDAFPMFASGIAAFLIGHIFYMILFGSKSWRGLGWKGWLAGIAGVAVLVFLLVKVLKVEGALLLPMAVYGFVLLMLSFCALCGVIRCREHRPTWWIILCGALLFAFSDSLIAAGTFGVATFALRDFVIMFTYLIAQSLLAWGAVRLASE